MSALRSPNNVINYPTSYQPLPSEYHAGREASSKRKWAAVGALVVTLLIVLYALSDAPKPAKSPRKTRTNSGHPADGERAKREQADMIERAEKQIEENRRIQRANPEKDGR